MLIISFDAVGDSEFELLMGYPAFSAFAGQAAVYRGVPTLCPSNTYPIHASVVTGVLPSVHGLISNTRPFPSRHPVWNNREDGIRAKTLWQAAAEKGVSTAAVFWPATGYSKTIRYNIPEMVPRPGKNLVVTLMKAGSKRLQAKMLLRHGKMLDGISQPKRDDFAAACMADIIREKRPGLALVHLTAYDSLCHANGRGSGALKAAFESLDRNLAVLLEAAGESGDVVVFSDHCQINLHTATEPNGILVRAGLMGREKDAWVPGESGCFIECCGGTAFFHAGRLPDGRVGELRGEIERSEGFRRFLTGREMQDSGYGGAAFGFCAQAGYSFAAFAPGHKAEHGYPPDMPDYEVFYMARTPGLPLGRTTRGGSLLDIAALAAKSLGIEMCEQQDDNYDDSKTTTRRQLRRQQNDS